MLGEGLSAILSSPTTLLWCLLGVTIGTLVSALPGIGTVTAMAVLLPLTFGLDPVSALVLLVSIYLGGMYGGRISSILLNIPGDASSVVSTFDGHPLARQGKAGFALTLSAVASFVGGLIGFVGLAALAGILAEAAILFGPAEYFMLVCFVLLATAGVSNASVFKSVAAVVIGILVAFIGLDSVSGSQRFTWGIPELWNGVDLVVIAVGLFGLSEILARLGAPAMSGERRSVSLRSLLPPIRSVTSNSPSMLRGGVIGFLIGILPGAGASMSTFVAYAAEKGIARDRSRFGKGDPRGLCAPEAADNGSVGGALIPTLSLGIPGSAAGALILGGLIMAGLQPGPLLFQNSQDIVWTVIAAVLVANVLLLVMNTMLVPLFASALQLLDPYLTAVISGLCVLGVYSLRNSAFDVLLMVVFGVVGYVMRTAGYPLGSLLLGVILGPMLEDNFRQALLTSRGDYSIFWGSTISVVLLALCVALIALTVVRGVHLARRKRSAEPIPAESDTPSAMDTMEPSGRDVRY